MPRIPDATQIQAIVRGLTHLTEREVIAITLDIHASLVSRPPEGTPRDLGWAAANWVPSVGRPAEGPVGDPARGGVSQAQSQARRGIAAVGRFRLAHGIAFVTNNVPYIERLNDGHSRQSPAGFVQRAIRKAIRQTVR